MDPQNAMVVWIKEIIKLVVEERAPVGRSTNTLQNTVPSDVHARI